MAKKIRREPTPRDDLFPGEIEDGRPGAYVAEPARLEQGFGLIGAQDVRPLGSTPLHLDQHSRTATSFGPIHIHGQHAHLDQHSHTAKPCGPADTQPVELLDPLAQPRFVNDLPLPERIDASRPGTLVLQIGQTEQWLGLVDANGEPLITTVWGYGQPGHTPTYPGPTLVAHMGTEIKVNWQNKLPLEGHLLPVDTTLHWAASDKKPLEDGYVPTVTHLHGAHDPSGSDGLPEQWFTQNYSSKGPDFEDRIYTYPNDQEAATLWYHDHTLGLTRL